MRKPPLVLVLLASGLIGALIGRVTASEPDVWNYGGFRIAGAAGLTTPQRDALAEQVDMVASLPVKPEVAAFFRRQPITLSRRIRQPGASGPEGVVLAVPDTPWRGPVLLHELLHLYHARRLPEGVRNPVVRAAYVRAGETDAWPPETYMMSNVGEFFAMTASAVLNGRVARPPGTRENVAARLPDYYRWIVAEFGLEVEGKPHPSGEH